MLPLTVAAGLAALCSTATASSTPQSWHLPLAGLVPRTSLASTPREGTLAQRFDPTGKGSTVLVQATEEHVLAGVQPRDGGVMWRRSYVDKEGAIQHLYAGDSAILAWTTPTASDLHAVSPTTGKLLWTHEGMADACEGEEASVFYAPVPQEGAVVQCGGLVRRFEMAEGEEKWSVRTSAPSVSAAAFDDQQVALFSSSGGKATVHLVDASSGTSSESLTYSVSLPASSPVHALSRPGSSSFAALWLEDSSLHGVTASSSALKPLKAPKLPFAAASQLVDVGLAHKGVVVALNEGKSSAAVLVLTEEGEVVVGGTFAVKPDGPAFAPYADPEGGIHLAYIDFSRVLQLASLQIWSLNPTNENVRGKGMVSAHSFPLEKEEFEGMRGFALQVLPLPPSTADRPLAPALSRIALTTSTGAVQLWEGENVRWVREEGLTQATVGPVGLQETLRELFAAQTDLSLYPHFLLAAPSLRSIYAISPQNDTFSLNWKAAVPAELAEQAGWGSMRVAEREERAVVLLDGKDGQRAVLDLQTGEELSGAALTLEMARLMPRSPLKLDTVGERTLVARASRDESTPPVWSFTLPLGQLLEQVVTQLSPVPLPGVPASRLTLLAITSTSASGTQDSLLTLLNAETGSLAAQLPLPGGAKGSEVLWDAQLKGWKILVTLAGKDGTEVAVYKLLPSTTSSTGFSLSPVAASAVLPGAPSLLPLGLSTSPLSLAQPALLLQDSRLGRVAAAPVRWLEALADGKKVGGGVFGLSGVRELLPPSPLRLPSLRHGPHPLSPFPARVSESAFWLSSGVDLFAAVWAPSRAFDRLSEGYNKAQVGIVVGVLAVATVAGGRWAASTRTKNLWESA
ncbi:hypothetical protein JCM10213_006763 [Rhodosporidiobolus nylandii]